MTVRSAIMNIVRQEDVNFLLTNRLPRRTLTRFMGWFSRIEQPLVCAVSLRVWGFFADLNLSDASTTRFRSMHDCFTVGIVGVPRDLTGFFFDDQGGQSERDQSQEGFHGMLLVSVAAERRRPASPVEVTRFRGLGCEGADRRMDQKSEQVADRRDADQ